jgi:Cu/Zn superoxide dismutase
MLERVTRRAGGHRTAWSARSRTVVGGSVVALLAAAALTAGCGAATGDPTGATADAPASGMPMPSGMAMGDPSATPADKIEGAKQATLTLLDTRPPGTDGAAGSAWLAQNDKGTTVTVTMTGLKPGQAYMAHLHAHACAKDNGGPHFKFAPAGPATPPNEVHLGFTADGAGKASMTVTSDRKVGDGARAVVVHPLDAMDNRLACADF